jgi:multiple antibiotic resistance protein
MEVAINAFLLGFPALFSIVNPIGGALIFHQMTTSRAVQERGRMARMVALYALLVLMVALWAGSYVLAFFGISFAALRIAGGFVVAMTAWGLLTAPEKREALKQEQASGSMPSEDIALFPMTIPITTGPGTMSVATALGAGHPHASDGLGWFFLGMTGAAALLSLLIWALYSFAERLTKMLGPTGNRTITRLSAFLLLCIGTQVLINGVSDVLIPILHGRPIE